MTIQDVFRISAQKLGLSEAEISAIIEKGEIEEAHLPKFKLDALITKDAALGDPEIRNAVLGKTLSGIDNEIFDFFRANYGDAIDPDKFDEIKSKRNTSEKVKELIAMLSGSYGSKIEQLQKAGNVSEEIRNQLDQVRKALAAEKSEKETLNQKLEEQARAFEKQRLEDRMKSYLTRKKYKNDDPDVVEYWINQKILQNAFKEAQFVFDETGKVQVRNPVDPSLPKFLGNDQTNPVTFEGLLDYLGKDLFAKNDAPAVPANGKRLIVDPETAKSLPKHMLEAVKANQKNL